MHPGWREVFSSWGFPGGSVVKNPPANIGDTGDAGLIPGSGKISWSRKWQPTPVFLPGKFHGQRSLASYSAWNHKELDTTEHTHRIHMPFPLHLSSFLTSFRSTLSLAHLLQLHWHLCCFLDLLSIILPRGLGTCCLRALFTYISA